MYYYQVGKRLAASFLEFNSDLDSNLTKIKRPEQLDLFLLKRNPKTGPVAWRVTDARQLAIQAPDMDVSWLDPGRMNLEAPELPGSIIKAIQAGTLSAVNLNHPKWQEALKFLGNSGRNLKKSKKRVHLLAVGDVGGVLLTALKLSGGEWISKIGICDLNEKITARWELEMGQISWPITNQNQAQGQNQIKLPEVEIVQPDQIFDCDIFLFAAAKAIPALDSSVSDVRMAQFAVNRPLIESFARQAREQDFRGLFIVLSDPVDALCQAAAQASNIGPDGIWDGLGLLPEQIQGFGLGVMNARAAFFAKRDPRFSIFLQEGRSFGAHGTGLVIADSIQHYHDERSRELTELALQANLRIRELGFKPYVAPAISSGAMQLLLTLQGAWHYASVPLGDIWFGVNNRFTPYGLEIETQELPDDLFVRLQETEEILRKLSK